MDLGAMILALVFAGGVKLSVMFLAARLLLRVHGSTHLKDAAERPWLLLPDEDLPEIRVLWWSLVLFGVSELTCGIEVYVLFHANLVLSTIHDLTSALGMGLFLVGSYLYLDKKLIHYGGDRCLVNRICRGCTFTEPAGCKFRPFLALVATFVGLGALGAFCVSTAPIGADMHRWMLPFPALNAWYDGVVVPWLTAHVAGYEPSGVAYTLSHQILVLEFRLIPGLGLLLAALAVARLQAGDEHRGVLCMLVALGMIAFAYLEVFLFVATGDVIIGSLGHEAVELWFLIVTAEFLSRAFGRAPAPV